MSCFDCKWCSGKAREQAECDWLYRAKLPPMPPFLDIFDKTMAHIHVGTDSCFPKWVDPSTANGCRCYEAKK